MKKYSVLLSVLLFFLLCIGHVLSAYQRPYRLAVEKTHSPALTYAIIKAESKFDPLAVSEAGAVGLMQVMPATAEFMRNYFDLEEGDLFDPLYNIQIGTSYLLYLHKRFSSFSAIVAAYNAGEGNVSRWLKDERYSPDGVNLRSTPFRETNDYLKKVRKNFEIYRFFYRKSLDFCFDLL